ncbi:E3 ubiquitin-protein ligase TRIM35-like [Alosa sapidissima]|uniref:E3 ubiquitin-protein ligase TRIM35-like n=1 Tax=Alosa sapidissima TaxID=34773 RepID=UPI001C090813|nr:E3 ubiquitin-protein ligase TRIM35-like [Alosa sapidissima]
MFSPALMIGRRYAIPVDLRRRSVQAEGAPAGMSADLAGPSGSAAPRPSHGGHDRKKVKISLHTLQQKLGVFEDFKKTCDQTLKLITTQANPTEKLIKEEFEKLHQFLRDEEAAKIAALRKEEKQKSKMMKKEIEKISREISSISDAIRDTVNAKRTDGITFLKV